MLKTKWIRYSIKLLAIYALLYFSTMGVIGLSAPGGYYSNFIHTYFNYPALVRGWLFDFCNAMLNILGYNSEIAEPYKIRLHGGRGINVVYGCLGIGVTCFWVAFVAANEARLKKKVLFIMAGSLAIFVINTVRMALLVILANNNRQAVFIKYHHTFFNIAAYGCIIFMMYLFGRKQGISMPDKKTKRF